MEAPSIVLIHGAWHTPLIWEPVRLLLEAAGRSVSAPNLPFDAADRFTADCVSAIASLGDLTNSVLIAQTSGALISPVVAQAVPVAALGFVNPLLPLIGHSFAEQVEDPAWDDRGSDGRNYDREARSFWVSKDDFARSLAADCTADQVDLIWGQLRPQSRAVLREVTPLNAWPQIASSVVIYEDDADIAVSWMEKVTRERLGVEPQLIPGSQLGFYAKPEPLTEWILQQLPS